MVQMPHAQILGVEQQQVDVLAFENGLWNRISGQDVQSEFSVLPELARKKAAESEPARSSRANYYSGNSKNGFRRPSLCI